MRENLAAMQRAIEDFSVQIRPEGFPFLHFVFSVMKLYWHCSGTTGKNYLY